VAGQRAGSQTLRIGNVRVMRRAATAVKLTELTKHYGELARRSLLQWSPPPTGAGPALGAYGLGTGIGHGQSRIDVHQHMIPPGYAHWLATYHAADAGGRPLPAWRVQRALSVMELVGTSRAILSVSAPGTAPASDTADAEATARAVNDFGAELVKDQPDRFGFLATVPLPNLPAATREATRALDQLHAHGLILLANNRGTYLGQTGQGELFAELDARNAVVFVHPAALPGPAVPGIPPFAADFLLDTTRAAYLLVRNGITDRYPRIRFILSHAGGFVPYAAHRIAISIANDTGQTPQELLEQLRSFYFDTALSASPATLPSLLAFAKPGHIMFGSDWPFAPQPAVQYFTSGLDAYQDADQRLHDAINHGNAAALFPG
jgi:6-methylsalicylate decarboxylase